MQEIRVELLPSPSSTASNRPSQRKQIVLFDVKPQFENRFGQMELSHFSSCDYLGNRDDESTTNCIDNLTDTGWMVPAFTRTFQSHQLVFRFAEPKELVGEHRMALTLDSGGSPELDVLSRLRVSFVAADHNRSK